MVSVSSRFYGVQLLAPCQTGFEFRVVNWLLTNVRESSPLIVKRQPKKHNSKATDRYVRYAKNKNDWRSDWCTERDSYRVDAILFEFTEFSSEKCIQFQRQLAFYNVFCQFFFLAMFYVRHFPGVIPWFMLNQLTFYIKYCFTAIVTVLLSCYVMYRQLALNVTYLNTLKRFSEHALLKWGCI